MRVIARSTLMSFVESLGGRRDKTATDTALRAWYHEVESAKWRNSADVKKSFATASVVGSERVVFNIKGNSYRLVTAIDYERQVVFIKWLGSHANYDRIHVRTVQ